MTRQEYDDKIDSLNKKISDLEQEKQDLKDEKVSLETEPEKNASNIARIDYQLEAKSEQIEQTISEKKSIQNEGYEKNWTEKIETATEQVYNAVLAGTAIVAATVSPMNDTSLHNTQSTGYEQEKENSNPHGPLEGLVSVQTEINERREKIEESNGLADAIYKDNLRPAEYQSVDSLLKDYQKDYNKAVFQTDSVEKAQEIANDKLLNKLELKEESNQENNNKDLTNEQKEEKIKDLLENQYGEKGRESFENIREQEKQKQQEIQEKQKEKQQEQSKSM